MTLIIQMPPDLESRLRAEAGRAGLNESQFVLATLEERLKKAKPGMVLSTEETALLSKINEGLPQTNWRRFHELNDKRQADALTTPEHAELLDLIGQVELYGAKRLGYLNQLAKLRSVTLDEVMAQLGISKL
jgi:hypothetical protein